MIFQLPTASSAELVLFNLVLLFAIFTLQRKALKHPFCVAKSNRFTAVFLMFIFVLFSFWGADWFHYKEGYSDLCNGYSGHMENIYVWIAQNLSIGYLSFRFAVWGTGLILLLMTIKRLPLKQDLVLLFWGSFWMIWFSYARVSLGLALCFWGLSVLYNPYRLKILSYILAITAISCSFVFHKSIFVLLFAVLLTFLSFRLNRKLFIVIVFFAIPLLVSLIKAGITTLFLFDVDASEGSIEQSISSGQYYLGAGQEAGIKGIGQRLATFLGAIPNYLLLVQSLRMSFKKNVDNVPKSIQVFIRLFVILVLIASLFLFDFGIDTSVLFIRFIRFAAFPCAILLAYFWENRRYPKLTRWTFYLAALSTLYSVSYSLYLNT